LQLPYVLAGIRDYSRGTLLLYGAVFSSFLILLRLVWTFPGAHLTYLIRRRVLHQNEQTPSARKIFVVGWTGMRGVISLAAAIALPQVLANDAPFVQRNLIIFLAFSVILVTLVLQGLTLPPLIRALGLAGGSGSDPEEKDARRAIVQAALMHLEEAAKENKPEFAEVYADLAQHYRQRLASLNDDGENLEAGVSPDLYKRSVDLSREILRVKREAAVRLRGEGRINDELLRQLERELDLDETRLSS
jgi:monovalent cation/hydrogen antiporter